MGVVESWSQGTSIRVMESWNHGIMEFQRSQHLPHGAVSYYHAASCIYNPIANNCQHFPTLPADMSAETPRTGVRK